MWKKEQKRVKSVAQSFMRNAGSVVCILHDGSDVCILRETLRNRFYSLREGARRQMAHDIPKTSEMSQTVANVLKLQSGLDNLGGTKH